MKTKNIFTIILTIVLLALVPACTTMEKATVVKNERVYETVLTISAEEYDGITDQAHFRGFWLRTLAMPPTTCNSPRLGIFWLPVKQIQGNIPSWKDTFFLDKTTMSNGDVCYNITKVGQLE